jgi:hypothetical protein
MKKTELVIFLITALFSLRAFADATIFSLDGQPKIGVEWSEQQLTPQYQKKFRDTSVRVDLTRVSDNLADFTHGSPTDRANFHNLYSLAEAGQQPFDQYEKPSDTSLLGEISQFCLANYSSIYERVSCAAVNAKKFGSAATRDDTHSGPCRTIDFMFRNVMLAMNIPVQARTVILGFYKNGGYIGHVATVVRFVNDSGYQQTYVVDGTFFPQVFFPYSRGTKEFHRQHPEIVSL